MAQVERATSLAGKQYLTEGVVRYTDIKTKTLTAGGTNNEDGIIEVLDGSGDLSVKLNNDGITLGDDRKIVGGDGVLTNLFFASDPNTAQLGIVPFTWYGGEFIKAPVRLFIYIPSTFKIDTAHVILRAFKTKNEYTLPDTWGQTSVYGKITNIKLYKATDSGEWTYSDVGYWDYSVQPTLAEITGAFGSGGYTNPTINEVQVTSIDITSHLVTGLNVLFIQTSDAVPTPFNDANTLLAAQKSQTASAYLSITGFTK
jgi:hypothetical protein